MSTTSERPRLAVDGDLVAELDWPRHERHAEVVPGEVVDADGDPRQHVKGMTQTRRWVRPT